MLCLFFVAIFLVYKSFAKLNNYSIENFLINGITKKTILRP